MIDYLKDRIFDISVKYNRSTYDRAYIAIAESMNPPFITGDKKLFNNL